MASHKYRMVQNDTGPPLVFDVTNEDGSPYNLTGCTMRLTIKDLTTGLITNTGHTACNIMTITNRAQYTFLSGDLPSAGKYICDFVVVDANNKVQTEVEYVEITCRPEIDAT